MIWRLFELFLLSSLWTARSSSQVQIATAPRVQLATGTVEGKTVQTPLGKPVDVFLGIPYGEAPVGRMRFKAPRPALPWTGVLETKVHGPACFQRLVPKAIEMAFPFLKFLSIPSVSEDCLKLSIWRPQASYGSGKLPVMVWIYGGGFAAGSAGLRPYQGEVLARDGQVILVSMNYRVGSLGFMYMGTEDVPGNAGLYDQVLALQWIRDNIGSFGGDPGKVTLFGQSAGAASVGYHMLSRASAGLFHRAVLQSGSPLSKWAYLDPQESIRESTKLIENLGCTKTNASSVAECLYSADAGDIVSNEPVRGLLDVLIYKPTVDGKFLLESPHESVRKGVVAGVDAVIGQNRNEASYLLAGLMPLTFLLKDNLRVPRSALGDIVGEIFPGASDLVRKLVVSEYNDWADLQDTAKTVDISDKILTDYYFTCPTNRFARALQKNRRKLYRYHYNHRTSVVSVPDWFGVYHGAEVLAVFGVQLVNEASTAEDVQVSRRVMKYWTNFAKHGNPNGRLTDGASADDLPVWPEHKMSENNHLDIRFNSTGVRISHREKYCALWDDMVPQLMEFAQTRT